MGPQSNVCLLGVKVKLHRETLEFYVDYREGSFDIDFDSPIPKHTPRAVQVIKLNFAWKTVKLQKLRLFAIEKAFSDYLITE